MCCVSVYCSFLYIPWKTANNLVSRYLIETENRHKFNQLFSFLNHAREPISSNAFNAMLFQPSPFVQNNTTYTLYLYAIAGEKNTIICSSWNHFKMINNSSLRTRRKYNGRHKTQQKGKSRCKISDHKISTKCIINFYFHWMVLLIRNSSACIILSITLSFLQQQCR